MGTQTLQLSRSDTTPWGFRLQGGKEFGTPLTVLKVNNNSLAQKAGLQPGDTILQIGGHSTDDMKHKEAQDTIIGEGNSVKLTIQRGGNIFNPVGQLPKSVMANGTVVSKTSYTQESIQRQISSKSIQDSGTVTAVMHKQFNSPAALYSMHNIAETLSAHTEILATGVKGINFMKEEQPINTQSAVYKLVHEEEISSGKASPAPHTPTIPAMSSPAPRFPAVSSPAPRVPAPAPAPAPARVQAPAPPPPTAPKPLPARLAESAAPGGGQAICAECGAYITGVFARIGDRSLHPDCFKCNTCGVSLKNVGHYNINEKLYCEVHAKTASKMASVEAIKEAVGKPVTAPLPPLRIPHQSPGLPSIHSVSPIPFRRMASEVHHVEPPMSPKRCQSPLSFAQAPPPQIGSQSTNPSQFISRPAPTKPIAPMSFSKSAYSKFTQITRAHSPVTDPTPAPPQDFKPKPASGQHGHAPGIGSRPAPRRGRGQLITSGGSRIPICAACASPIRGPFIMALSKSWCPDHFLCTNSVCRQPLQDIGFVEDQGQLYCENCYEAYLAPVCAKCNKRIKEECLIALDKHWHTDCFICAYCNKPFGNDSFFLEDGLPYCEKDWNELFTTKCVGCGFPIEAGDRWVEALNNNYHSQCFKCTICHKNLEGQSFYAKAGRPICKAHAR
uniref:PDZ and LIM protein Zasp isoform X3 n=1 Tax=Centruroides hentzi TaxID=88313 RepID=A0A2I9LPF9_9SCOR